MEFTAIRDLKSGMKNLNVMFIVLDVGKFETRFCDLDTFYTLDTLIHQFLVS